MSNGGIGLITNNVALGLGRETGTAAVKAVTSPADVTADFTAAAARSAKSTESTKQAGSTAEANPAQPAEVQLSPREMTEAVGQLREYVRQVVPELDFSIDEDTGKVVVKVMDTEKNEVLRQIPSEEMLHVAKMLDKLQGLLYRGRA